MTHRKKLFLMIGLAACILAAGVFIWSRISKPSAPQTAPIIVASQHPEQKAVIPSSASSTRTVSDQIQSFKLKNGSTLMSLTKGDDSGYEIWLVDLQGKKIPVASEVLNAYGDSFWVKETKTHVITHVMKSPGEAFADFLASYYSKDDGRLQYTLSTHTDGPTFDYTSLDPYGTAHTVTVSMQFDGVCSGMGNDGVAYQIGPLETLHTLVFVTNDATTTIALPEPRKVFCDEQYGGGFIEPALKDVSIDGDTMRVQMPGGVFATFLPDAVTRQSDVHFTYKNPVWPKEPVRAEVLHLLTPQAQQDIAKSPVPVLLPNDSVVLPNDNNRIGYLNDGYLYNARISDSVSYTMNGFLSDDNTQLDPPNAVIHGQPAFLQVDTTSPSDKTIKARWRENGVDYESEIFCSEYAGPDCLDPKKLTDILSHLEYFGGRGAVAPATR